MTAATRRRPAVQRGPSTRYPTVAADGTRVIDAFGRELPAPSPLEACVAARQLAGDECVLWIHRTALETWKLPERPGDHAEYFGQARAVGGGGWLVVDELRVHVAIPAYLGDFDGPGDVVDLVVAVEAFRRSVGMGYLFSGSSTVHKLIRSLGGQLDATVPEPELPGYAQSAWAVPANSWGLDSLELLGGRRFVRVFDRSGSYLSAWRGLNLGVGDWQHFAGGEALPGPESHRQCGYWLVDAEQLPHGHGLADPFRRHGDDPGPRWITTPLLQLAVELTEGPLPFLEAWVTGARARPLDPVGTRLAEAREQLAGDDDPAAGVALEALKVAYAGATAWFEYGPKPPDPLARPLWRRSIIDRYAANTFRGLAKCTPGPFAVTEIDAALFAVDDVDELPDGMRIGTGLGAWKPKGRAVPMVEAIAAYAAGGARAVVQLAEGDAT